MDNIFGDCMCSCYTPTRNYKTVSTKEFIIYLLILLLSIPLIGGIVVGFCTYNGAKKEILLMSMSNQEQLQEAISVANDANFKVERNYSQGCFVDIPNEVNENPEDSYLPLKLAIKDTLMVFAILLVLMPFVIIGIAIT